MKNGPQVSVVEFLTYVVKAKTMCLDKTLNLYMKN